MGWCKSLFAKFIDRTTRVAADWLQGTRTREQNLALVGKLLCRNIGLNADPEEVGDRAVCERLLNELKSGKIAKSEPIRPSTTAMSLAEFHVWIAGLPKRSILDAKRLHPESGTNLLSVASMNDALSDEQCRAAFEVLLRHLELRRLPAGIEFTRSLSAFNHWRECGRAVSALARYAHTSDDPRYLNGALKLADRIAAAHESRFRTRAMSWSACLGILECEVSLDELRTRVHADLLPAKGASS